MIYRFGVACRGFLYMLLPMNGSWGLLGHAAVLCAAFSAILGCVAAFVAGYKRDAAWLQCAITGVHATTLGMLAANASMVAALLLHDFSVAYVAQVGSRATPALYTVVSLWSSLEGSILFWGLILSVYTSFFALRGKQRDTQLVGYALGTILLIMAFFAYLIAYPANPFGVVSPVPADGPGPNPLLQNHPLMIIHPPMLYLGYVGLTIPFGIATAALLAARLDDAWLRILRRWTMMPWLFLSVGIILGGWWAYEVLGWGGYWAWDPVENASFLPWLAVTAYLHAAVMQESRRMLKAWTLSLVLAAFMLTILGTFMTRSGVFNSVHSFTQSAIGPVFLGFLGVVLVASLLLLALRSHLLESPGRIKALISRETAFLLNNMLFVAFTLTVLLGTLFPLMNEAITDVKVSVGEPYYNRMAIPIGLMMVFLMGVGPVLPWGQPNLNKIWRDFLMPLGCGALLMFVCLMQGMQAYILLLNMGICGFAAFVTLRELVLMLRLNLRRPAAAINRRRLGGYVVHLAVILIVAAIGVSQTYRISAEAMLAVGESIAIGDYKLTFLGAKSFQEAHRFAVIAPLQLSQNNTNIIVLQPRLNFYNNQREPIGTPHVFTRGSTDIYASVLSIDRDGQHVAVKIFLIPWVPWLWRSLPLLVAGALLSLWPRRRVLL